MTTTTKTLLVPHSIGGSFPILYYPTTPNRLWCDIQFVEGTTDVGYLHFYTASGGNAGDLKHYLINGDTPAHPTPVVVDTISCYTLILTARQVDELFDEKFIKDFWLSWHELFTVFNFENMPESLNLALSIVYTRMENRT